MSDASDRIGTELLFENDRFRVWDMVLEPGEDSELHRHTNDYLFVYVTDDNGLEIAPPGQDAFRQRCADGQTAHWEVGAEPGPAYSHTLRNVGTRTHRQILVELPGSSRSQESTGRPETNGRCE